MKDFIAGVIVAIIAIPLSIALGIASGVSPEKGLYTAIIGGFIVAIFGGSRVQIAGPTGAFVVIVYGIIDKYGMDGLIIATVMAGIILVIMGFLKLGSLIKYIPSSITSGFTNGIAIVILSTQVKDLLGLSIKSVPAEFIAKWEVYIKNMNTINWQSVLISAVTVGIILLWPKINKKIPGTIVGLIVATGITMIFGLNVPTIGSQFGNLSASLPTLSIPSISFNVVKELIIPAFTIAILAGVESLLSAVVADNMIDDKHDSNMELVGQGLANIGSAMFGGIPVTGAIARTAANVKNDGRTPVSAIVHSIGVLIIMLILMPYVKLLPMASLGGILLLVAYNMGEWEIFKDGLKAPKSDVAVFLITFLLTVFCDLVVAILAGVVIASFLFMRNMAEITTVDEHSEVKKLTSDLDGVLIYEVKGPLFFAATNKLVDVIRELEESSQVFILKMKSVPFLDSTAYHAFESLKDNCEKKNIELLVVGLQEQPMELLTKYEYIDSIGENNVLSSLDEALERTKSLIA